MLRLIRGVLALALLGALVYGAATVPLGERTLWQHLKAIAASDESRDLVDGVKAKAGELASTAGDDEPTDGTAAEASAEPPKSAKQRKELKDLIRRRMARHKPEGAQQ